MRRMLALVAISGMLVSCARKPIYDVVLWDGLICDGAGSACTAGGVAISGDRIARPSHGTRFYASATARFDISEIRSPSLIFEPPRTPYRWHDGLHVTRTSILTRLEK